MSFIIIPETMRDTRHCQFDDENPLAGTQCPHALDDNAPPCNTCEYALHDVHHIAYIALRLREIPVLIDGLAEEKNPWPITKSRSEVRALIENLLAEFQELSELMKKLEVSPDLPDAVPSAIGYQT